VSTIDIRPHSKLTKEEITDGNGDEKEAKEQDKIWAKKNATKLNRCVKEAKALYEFKKEIDTPLELLEAALKKLTHENMNPCNLDTAQYENAMRVARAIQERANELERQFYAFHKELKKINEM
jgi:hypothetical protein